MKAHLQMNQMGKTKNKNKIKNENPAAQNMNQGFTVRFVKEVYYCQNYFCFV